MSITTQHIHSPLPFPSQIVLPQALSKDIHAHTRRVYPHEACGLLLGVRRDHQLIVSAVIECDNAAKEAKGARFEIAPSALFAAHRKARANSVEVLGHYHSHPNGVGQPSKIDEASIADQTAVWLIQPIEAGIPGKIAAFYPARDGQCFKPLALLEQQP